MFASIKELVNTMAPAMLSQLLPPMSSMLATKLVAGFGAATVAAWALGSRLEFFFNCSGFGANHVDAADGRQDAWCG